MFILETTIKKLLTNPNDYADEALEGMLNRAGFARGSNS
jgi:hypothetical protein